MTDAERLAKAYVEGQDMEWGDHQLWSRYIAAAQRLIDSGLVTVNPPPDPVDLVMAEFVRRCSSVGAYDVLRSMLDDRWIDPGPRCDQ